MLIGAEISLLVGEDSFIYDRLDGMIGLVCLKPEGKEKSNECKGNTNS